MCESLATKEENIQSSNPAIFGGIPNCVFTPFQQPLLLLTNQDEKATTQNKRRSFTQTA